MAYKDILVYADGSKAAKSRFDAACALAASHGAHLAALHVRQLPFVPADFGAGVPPLVIEWQERAADELVAEATKAVEEARRRSGQAIEWRLAQGEIGAVTLLHSRYADLTIVSQGADDVSEATVADGLPEALVMGSGRPALIVPRYGQFSTVGERVLVAWNRTREATRAVHDALPLLTRAKAVTVMEVNPRKGEVPHIAGAEIATHLARLGVKAEVSSTVAEDINVGDAILSRLSDLGADLLVMGAYGHSRLREYAFGGVTLHILKHMTVPVLMSH